MWNRPSETDLVKIPALYTTERTSLKEKIVHLHFFIGGCDWYVVEFDSESQIFFGFAVLNGDLDSAEWGYFSLMELDQVKIKFMEIDRDLHFKPKRAIEVDMIRKAQGWGR